MSEPADLSTTTLHQIKCNACKDGLALPFSFSMAFQPIVNVETSTVYAYEALVRGTENQPASTVLSQLTSENRYAFDQGCRAKSISLAAELGLAQTGAKLSINFMPGSVYSPAACIKLTLETARRFSFPLDRLIFEITEGEEVADRAHLVAIAQEYRRHGFLVALDDLGAGYAGLNVLADIAPEVVKIDMDLVRDLHRRRVAREIIRSLALLCDRLGMALIGEGVETIEEYDALFDCGVFLMQGFLLAKPAFEALPIFTLPQRILTGTDGG